MRRIGLLIALTALLGLPVLVAACGGDDEAGGTPAGEPAASAVPFDRAFIDAMVPHHEEAIFMANEAKDAALSQPDLVQIANDIIATQQAEIDQMLEWREAWFGSAEVDPAGTEALGMSREEMGMQHDPGDLSVATDVDATFASMMIDHHNGAIAMARLALERGEHAELMELAQAIIDAQEREVETLMQHASGMMDHS